MKSNQESSGENVFQDAVKSVVEKLPGRERDVARPSDKQELMWIREAHQTIDRAGFPLRHRTKVKNLAPEIPDGAWRSAYEGLIHTMRTPGAIVALVGPRGTGKTQMATLCAYEIAKREARRGGHPTFTYCRAIELFMSLKDSYSAQSGEKRALLEFVRPSLLVLDEVQVRSESAWEDNTLTYVIDNRYAECRATILISNLTPEAFAQSMGSSIMDRLAETGAMIECVWPSFRGACAV